MKKVLMATAFAALIASPVLAQSPEGQTPRQTQAAHTSRTAHQQVAKHGRTEGGLTRSLSSNAVYGAPGAAYLGSDPDPLVRQQLLIDGTSD
jgi:hypothetical protein